MFGLAKKQPGVIDGNRARELVAKGARLIDVRTPREFAEHRIDGSENVPLQDIECGTADLGENKRTLIVYCRSGARSARARRFLEEKGYTVFDMSSVDDW
jgi:rhodanese-related sulfurtransferase